MNRCITLAAAIMLGCHSGVRSGIAERRKVFDHLHGGQPDALQGRFSG